MQKEFDGTQNLFAVTFFLPASATDHAQAVQLVGDFNNWGHDTTPTMLDRQADGSFSAVVHLAPGRQYAFRFLIDGTIWENAHDADAYVASPFSGIENSLVSLPAAPKPQKAPKKASAPAPKAPKRRRKVKVDDLKVIEGVGPKIAGLLAEAGIDSWAKMAKTKPAALKKVLNEAGSRYKMHNPATWPEQARLAAAGDWEGLKSLQDSLKGGKA